ncbi:MAG: PadR family transcriptional regulator [Lewinellaceae bacterium]|nr:PadR family transcriptional regulator [Lewinella sp.]MCB9280672.1 PadR family transcriptional regulator [Lewinellaceae bacterium]
MNDRLGHLEEMILFMVMLVHEEAYGITVRDAFTEQYGQDISLSAVHTVLRRLEEKGFTASRMGGSSQERGGRRKRLYQVTRYGYKMITQIQDERTRIWELLPKLNF